MNGVPSCANMDILTTKARNEWGFNGYVTSDCGAVSCIINDHHYTNTSDETCAVVLNAGMVQWFYFLLESQDLYPGLMR